MKSRKEQMEKFMRNFKENQERLNKYTELLLLREDTSPCSYLSRKNLRSVNVVLTTKCNLNCVWCHRHETRFKKDYLQNEMPLELLKKLLPSLQGFERLYFAGLGEPMLYPYIFEAIKEAKRVIPDVRTTTNGTLLSKENCHRVADSGLDYIEVSIDGFDSVTNKKLRGVHEDKLIDNLKYLSDNSDIPIQINTVISDVNYESLFDEVDRLKDVGNIILIHTIPLFMTNHMVELGIGEITAEQHRELLMHWKARIKELNLNIEVWPDTYETDLDPIMIMKRKHNLCFTVYDDAFINVFGHLTPCSRLQEISLEDVLEQGFDNAWNGTKMTQWRQNQINGNYSKICQLECHMKNTKNSQ